MKTTAIKLLIFSFFFSFLISCSSDDEAKQFPLDQPSVIDAEDYNVYAAIIDSYSADKFVLKQKTLSGYTFIDDYFIEQLSEDNPGFEPEMAATLLEVNQNPLYLEESFNVSSISVVLVSEAQLEYIFNNGYSENDWNQFHDTFSNSESIGYGYNQFSAVAYNADKTKALVETANVCGPLCGLGLLIYLEKENGIWMIKKSVQTWIS
ncbi:hypothetical protein [Flavobacterium sp.]|uniref:hypothetical protein n=1 Tax=Flavobacterium sp. TaxID=239 RepID=UPI002636B3CE|nr:hypothetical protein [Flavobacterium sp.]